jgi:N-acetylneuraminate lyase
MNRLPAKLTGLIPAVFTPFHADGRIDLDRIVPYAERLRATGVSAVFVCGTTGESASLTVAERQTVAEAWCRVSGADWPAIVQVGHNCLADAQTLARHAAASGAHGIAALAPSYFKPAGIAELVDWCAGVAAAAPALPFYYYHIPALTGVSLPVAEFLAAAGPRIPNLAGVKFTYEDLRDLQAGLALENGRYQVLFGRDEFLLSGLVLGCEGAVGSTYNFAAPLYQRLLTAYRAGDLARARLEQRHAAEFIAVMCRHGGLPALKTMMKLAGFDCGPVRLPLRILTAAEADALRRDLSAVGFFEHGVR